MFGILEDIADSIGKVVGTVCGIPIAALSVTLGVSQQAITTAVDAGCETVEEIKDFLEDL